MEKDTSSSAVLTPETAVAVMVSDLIAAPIQAVRAQFDKNYRKWSPHIKLLHPFFSDLHFSSPQSEIVQQISKLLAEYAPFTVKLESLECFEQLRGCTLVVRAVSEPPYALEALHDALLDIFPACRKGTSHFGGYFPHLTLGHFAEKWVLEKEREKLKATWQPIEFKVSQISLIAQPLSLRHSLPLTGSKSLTLATAPASLIPLPAKTQSSPGSGGIEVHKARFVGLPTYRYDSAVSYWAKVDPVKLSSPASLPATLSVVTYNILFDLYDKELIHTSVRVPALIKLLQESNADVIGLQEVTQPFHAELLSHDWVRRHYYVSDSESTPTLKKYGQVLLSRFPFVTSLHSFGKKSSKNILLGEFTFASSKVCAYVIHLPSERSGQSSGDLRMSHLQVVYDHADSLPYEVSAVVMGDFNFGDEEDVLRPDLVDCWKVLKPDDPGFTYNPDINTLARAFSLTKKPKRYDRVLLRSLHYAPRELDLIGTAPLSVPQQKAPIFPSDHFGLRCLLALTASSTMDAASSALEEYLRVKNVIAGPQDLAKRVETLAMLRDILRHAFTQLNETEFFITPIGSHALGTESPASDLDVLCLGHVPRRTFVQQVRSSLVGRGVKELRVVAGALVPVVNFKLNGVEIDLQYACLLCPLGPAFSPASLTDIDIKKLDHKDLLSLNGLLECGVFTKAIPDMSAFRFAMAFVKLWATRRGIYSNRHGYLGGFAWAILLARVCQLYPSASAVTLLSHFFRTYATFNWSAETPSVEFPPFAREPRDHLPVVLPCKPHRNAARNVTPSTRVAILHELERASKIFATACQDNTTLITSAIDKLIANVSPALVAHYERFVCVTVSAVTRREFIEWSGFIDSKIVEIILRLEACGVSVRPFTEATRNPSSPFPFSENLLIAIDCPESLTDKIKRIQACLLDLAGTFTSNPLKTAGMDLLLKLLERSQLPALENLSLSDNEEEQDQEKEELEEEAEQKSFNNPKKPRKAKILGDPNSTHTVPKDQKMHYALEVYNRIRWDASLNPADFFIGYEDRFLGIVESPLAEFDLESIPFHRIRHFRRGQEIVWDRKLRIDKIFTHHTPKK